ncbi:MAG: membrane protein insertase YidC, partial [Psittacicella sp.]
MNIKRNIVLIIFFIFTLFIFLNWHDYTNSANMPVGTTASNLTSKIDLELQNPQSGVLVNIKTNTLDLTINNHGNIINSYLLHYTDLKSKNIFKLLTSEAGNSYIAQVGLTGPNGIDYVKNGQDVSPVYTVQKPMYTISNGQKELDVPLTYKDGNVTYIKTYIVKPDSYTVTVKYSIENNSAKPLNLIPYAQLLHTDTAKGGLFSRSEVKAAYSSSSSNFNKYSFEEIKKSNLNVGTNSGWVGMLQHYFTVALIPGKTVGNGISKDSNQDLTSFNSNYTLYTKYNNALNLATIGYISKQITVNPNSQATASMTMWIGPNLPSTMATVAPHLNLAVNYGYLWFISKPLFVILKFIHSFIGNWG